MTATDLLPERGQRRTDALIMSGGDDDTSVRVVVRPSGTEPKVKSYIEVRCGDRRRSRAARVRAKTLQDELAAAPLAW